MSCITSSSAFPISLDKLNAAHHETSNTEIGNSQILSSSQGIAKTRNYERYEYNQANQLRETALLMAKVALGNRSSEVASILNKLGSLFFEQGDLDSSMNAYKQGLEIELELYGSLHPNIVITLSNLGHICSLRGENDTCLRFLEKAVEIQRCLSDDYHPNVRSTLSSIASIHYRKNDYTAAFYVYQELLRIHRKVHGSNHVQVAANLSSMGHVLYHMDMFEPALESFEESLQILRSLCHQKQDIACILSNIAAIHLKLGDEDLALSYFNEILDIQKRAEVGNVHTDVVSTLRQIGLIYHKRGEFCQAIDCLNEIVEIQKELLQNKQISAATFAQTLMDIGNIHLQNGQTQKMVSAFSDALRYLRLAGATEDDLDLSDFSFYELAKMHPECAPVA